MSRPHREDPAILAMRRSLRRETNRRREAERLRDSAENARSELEAERDELLVQVAALEDEIRTLRGDGGR